MSLTPYGARKLLLNDMKKFFANLARNFRIVAPNEKDWMQSKQIVNQLVAADEFDIRKAREISFDVVVAITARRIGAYLIT